MRYNQNSNKGSSNQDNNKISSKWKEDLNNGFINPYHFVGLSAKKIHRSEAEKGKISGVLHCSLYTKTPLGIPDVLPFKEDEKGHKSYDFFSYDGKNPIIPGSSLRGVIRSAHETVYNSCMSKISDKALSFRSTIISKPGILKWNTEKEQWELYKTTKYMFKVRECRSDNQSKLYKKEMDANSKKYYIRQDEGRKIYAGEEVKFEIGENYKGKNYFPKTVTKISDKEEQEGILILRAEFVNKKHHDSIFSLDFKKEPIKCNEKVLQKSIKNYEKLVTIYLEKDEDREEEERFGYQYMNLELSKKKLNAVWFYEVKEPRRENAIYLSPACITRRVCNNDLITLLGDKKPCSNKKELCSTCRLFGMINQKEGSEKNNQAVGSRIRFTDAYLEGGAKNCFMERHIPLKELGSPQISSMEFYTKRPMPDAKNWNYDFAITQYAKKENKNIDKTAFIKENKCILNGRKFYWHNIEKNYKEEDEKKISKRNSSMQLVKEGQKFKFDIYFEQITEAELKKLIWVVTIGENKKESAYCHKIGHGKPLGLGSVKIEINQLQIRNYTEEGYLIEDKTSQINTYINEVQFEDASILEQYKDMMNLEKFEKSEMGRISYPKAYNAEAEKNNASASHQWFAGNKELSVPKMGVGKGTSPIIKYVLDECRKNYRLPYLEKNKK